MAPRRDRGPRLRNSALEYRRLELKKSGEETRVSVDQLLDVFFDVFALHVGVKFLQHLGRYLDRESAVETLNKCFFTFGIPLSETLNNSDGFTQRLNRPWPRASRNSFPWRLITNLKFGQLRRGITHNLL